MKSMKIGIIGLGFVGETIYYTLKFFHQEVVGYDKFKSSNSLKEVMDTDVIFIALPTDGKDGRLDCSLILETLESLGKIKYPGVIVLKSTLSLDFINKIEKTNQRIVIMPEFLHQKIRLQDFVRPKVVVIGGKNEEIKVVMNEVFYWLEEQIPVYKVDFKTAVMSKLVLNAYAALKISFANEVRMICSDYGMDPKTVMRILVSEGRAASEYTDPTKGPFRGKCLPKDVEELINCSDKSILLKAVWEVNELVKKELYQQ